MTTKLNQEYVVGVFSLYFLTRAPRRGRKERGGSLLRSAGNSNKSAGRPCAILHPPLERRGERGAMIHTQIISFCVPKFRLMRVGRGLSTKPCLGFVLRSAEPPRAERERERQEDGGSAVANA